MSRKFFEVLDIKIDILSFEEAEDRLADLAEKDQKSIICTPNTEFIVKAQHDDEFKRILNQKSKMNLPDSFGVLWAARFLTLKNIHNKFWRAFLLPFIWLISIILLPFCSKKYKLPLKDKISGSDFIWSIARYASKNNKRLFLFGGAPTVAERAALKLQTDIYDLRVAGVFPGDMTIPTAKIIEAINRSKADILLVCLGSPLQEKWLDENLAKTCCNIGIGLGGTFDFTAQIVPRAPIWMQSVGLEWLFRLIVQPKRILRQLSLPKFAYLVLKEKLQQ